MKNIFFGSLFLSFLLFLFLNLPSPIKVQGDGVFYYSWLRSAVYDRDFDFRNELEHFSRDDYYSQKFTEENILTQEGKTPNPYAYGSAILWLPFFALGHLSTILFAHMPADGYSFLFVFLVNFGTWLYGVGALYFIVKSCLLIFDNEKKEENNFIWFVALGIWFSTPWLYYQLLAPSMSHIPSLFLSSLFLFLALQFWYEQKINYWLLSGTIFLLCATRWQNIVFVFASLPLFLWMKEDRKKSMSEIIKLGSSFVVPISLFVLSQMLIWKNIYGEYLLVPQGQSFIRPEFHGIYILFSSDRGLLFWSPFLIFAFIGMPLLWRRSKIITSVVCSAFILVWLINGLLSDLGGGEAFGARRFLELLPFLSLPTVLFWGKFKKYQLMSYFIIGVFVIVNLFFMEQYRLGLIPRSGEFDLWKGFFYYQAE